MIVCPKCKLEKHLVMMQPEWYIGKINKIRLSVCCTECEINFDVSALLCDEKVIKSSIQKNQ